MRHFLEKAAATLITGIAMAVASGVGGKGPLAPFLYFALIIGLCSSYKLLSGTEKTSGGQRLLTILISYLCGAAASALLVGLIYKPLILVPLIGLAIVGFAIWILFDPGTTINGKQIFGRKRD